MKKITSLILAIIIFCSVFTFTASAKSTVAVQIAPFYTQINDISIYNSGAKYPLLLYKGVTYIPMTYYLSMELGLVVGYDKDEGLYITRDPSGVNSASLLENPIELFGGKAVNTYGKLYDAVIPSYPVYLNGVNLTPESSEYPVLNFRDVTYLPMTYEMAVEELNFNLKWSGEEYALYLDSYNGMNGGVYVTDITDNYIDFQEHITVYKEFVNEISGTPGYTRLYDYYAQYRFDTDREGISTLGTSSEAKELKATSVDGALAAEAVDIELSGSKIYYDGLELLTLSDTNFDSAKGKKYTDGENIFILASIWDNDYPAPYTPNREYLFVLNDTGATQLSQWDELNNLSGIYRGQDSAYYICSNSYSPFGMARYSNSFSTVYRYTSDKSLRELTADYENLNSITVIGEADGKLYVKGMNYYADKTANGMMNFTYDAVNSGYYVIDTANGCKITRIYPYISGTTFIAADGTPYCITDYAKNQKLLNLISGRIYEFR